MLATYLAVCVDYRGVLARGEGRVATLDLETKKDKIDGLLSDLKQLLTAAVLLSDDLTADDANLPQSIINAAVEKIDKFEGLLTKRTAE